MNTSCNYRCGYCTQRFLDDRGHWASDLPRFLAAFARLPGAWEIKLSGGEPFVHPEFLSAVRGLAELGWTVRRASSPTSPRSRTSSRPSSTPPARGSGSSAPRCTSTTWRPMIRPPRPASPTPSQFIARCRYVRARLPAGASLCVTCVATREALPLLPGLADS